MKKRTFKRIVYGGKIRFRICPRCQGTGTFLSGETCYYCHGTGTVSAVKKIQSMKYQHSQK